MKNIQGCEKHPQYNVHWKKQDKVYFLSSENGYTTISRNTGNKYNKILSVLTWRCQRYFVFDFFLVILSVLNALQHTAQR